MSPSDSETMREAIRTARLRTGIWARALMRGLESRGGSAMLIRKGDEDAGALLIVLLDRTGRQAVLREAALGAGWDRIAMDSEEALGAYLDRQKRYDPDLWILEFTMDRIDDPIERDLPGRTG